MQPVFACRLSFARAPWASGWRAGDAALSAQRRVPDGVRPRVTREVRSGCVAVSLAECLVLWFCVSLLCDRHRPSSVHPYRVGVPVVGRTVFRLPINQSINETSHTCSWLLLRCPISSSLSHLGGAGVGGAAGAGARCGAVRAIVCLASCRVCLRLFLLTTKSSSKKNFAGKDSLALPRHWPCGRGDRLARRE